MTDEQALEFQEAMAEWHWYGFRRAEDVCIAIKRFMDGNEVVCWLFLFESMLMMDEARAAFQKLLRV